MPVGNDDEQRLRGIHFEILHLRGAEGSELFRDKDNRDTLHMHRFAECGEHFLAFMHDDALHAGKAHSH